MQDMTISATRSIPGALLSVRYSRSGGPGGQHVNKVETKVDLRLDLDGLAEVWGQGAVSILRTHLASRLDADGCVQIIASEHRDRTQNLDAACMRLANLISEALKPRKKRRATRPTRASKERRLDTKRKRSDTKKQRRKPGQSE